MSPILKLDILHSDKDKTRFKLSKITEWKFNFFGVVDDGDDEDGGADVDDDDEAVAGK